MYDDALIECLEVFIQTVLYIRKLYPEEIFRRRKIYSIPVYVSIYPPLNDYIKMVLKTAKYLLSERKLHKLEIVFFRGQGTMEQRLENYFFENESLQESFGRKRDDVHLFDFEDSIKRSLLQMEERIRGVSRLPSNAKFKILLHTTKSAYIGLSEKPELCDFIWYRDDIFQRQDPIEEFSEKKEILPVTGVADIGLQIYMERHLIND